MCEKSHFIFHVHSIIPMIRNLPDQRPVKLDIRKRSSQYSEFHLTRKTTCHFPNRKTSYGMWSELKNPGEVDMFLSTNFKILNNFQKKFTNTNVWNIPFRVLRAIRFLRTLATHRQSFLIDISPINFEIKIGRFAIISSASSCTSQPTTYIRVSSCKTLVIFVQVWKTLNDSKDIKRNPKYIISQKFLWWDWCCSMGIHGRGDVPKLRVAFRRCFVDASKSLTSTIADILCHFKDILTGFLL